jgi:phenylacetate-coenzyme A ligase PaaK-like adenylate-forming protein
MAVAMVPWLPRNAVLARQRQRLQALLAHAAAHSPLYARRLRGLDPATTSLRDIEPATKAELMQHFGDWITDPRLSLQELNRFAADPARIGEPCCGGHTMWTSSGSSGEPALFVQDAHAMAVYDALEALRRPVASQFARWFGRVWSGERLAFIGATQGHFASSVSIERLRRLSPGMASALRGFDFLLPVAELVARLEGFAPTVIATYPTSALVLAEEARAGRLRITPAEVWTGGETLSPAMRRFIEGSFGCSVVNSYGASEFLAMAADCRCGHLHLNDDWLILESVDEALAPVPDGERGCTTLLTNLANRVQPIIRYDLGDRVTVHREPCACGSPLPRIDVEGRSDDLLALRGGRHRTARLSPLALVTVLEEEAGVFDFQLEQTDDDALLLRVANGLDADAAHQAMARAREALGRYLVRQGLPKVRLDVVCAAPVMHNASGKTQRVVQRAACEAQLGDEARADGAPGGAAARRERATHSHSQARARAR